MGENFHCISGRIQEEPGNGIDLSEKNDIDFSEKLGFQKSRVFNAGALSARHWSLVVVLWGVLGSGDFLLLERQEPPHLWKFLVETHPINSRKSLIMQRASSDLHTHRGFLFLLVLN